MKAITMISGGTTTLVLGTAAAIPAENAISNDVSKLKGKSFEEAYKNGYWKVRFFRTDYDFDFLKGLSAFKVLDGYKECNLEPNEEYRHWLVELTRKEFKDALNLQRNDLYFLLFVEFKKNNDWFNKSVTRAWFGVNGNKTSGIETVKNRKEQILKAISSEDEILTKEVFTALNDKGSEINHKNENNAIISHWYVHDKLLKSPLNWNMEKLGNCRKLKAQHRITV